MLPLSEGSGPGESSGLGWTQKSQPLAFFSTSPWHLSCPPLGFPGRGMCLCVCLAFLHLTTLLQQHPHPPLFLFFGGAGPCGGRGQAPAHSSPVSEALGLQACSLQCLCCVCFPPMGGRGACVGLGDSCLKATPPRPPPALSSLPALTGLLEGVGLLGGQRGGCCQHQYSAHSRHNVQL